MKSQPGSGEIEVTVFGPGYGEAIIVHVGSGRWLLFDTCTLRPTGRPVALQYFDRIGVKPYEQVDLVLFSHWHDDHIRGASELVEQCNNAEICISAAFTKDEFIRYFSSHATTKMSPLGTGVDEFNSILSLIKENERKILLGVQNKLILDYRRSELAHDEFCEVWTLSPSDYQVAQNLERIKPLIPISRRTGRFAVPDRANNNSVAVMIKFGKLNIILGSDLEVTSDKRAGWDAVVNSMNRMEKTVSLFKVPHHGSKNGHHDGLWTKILANDVCAVVTPWNLGSKLPTPTDLSRLRDLTSNLHLTSIPTSLHYADHLDPIAGKIFQESMIRPIPDPNEIGAVTARTTIEDDYDWRITRWTLS